MVHQHEEDEWFRTWFYALPTPDVPALTFGPLHALNMTGHVITLYTDGSCQHSASPATRNAGFAVVADLAQTQQYRQALASRFQQTGEQPSSLQVLTATHLQGEQNIHRAEPAAVVFACERFANTHVISDSQITLHIAERCLMREPLSAFAMMDNYDLIVRLWQVLQFGSRSFAKIKAHKCLTSLPLDDLYIALGNKLANDQAIEVISKGMPIIQTTLQNRHTDVSTCQKKLTELYQFHLETHRTRALAEAQANGQAIVNTPARQIDRMALANYTVQNPWTPQPIRVNSLVDSAGGPTISHAILRWARQVQWPTAPDQHALQELGVTWIELALSFMFATNLYLPIRQPDQEGILRLLVPLTDAEMLGYSPRFSDVSDLFSVLVNQVMELIDVPLWPDIPKQQVRSLYVQGALQQSRGFAWRPTMPDQQRVTSILDGYLKKHRAAAFDTFPSLKLQPNVALVEAIKKETAGDWLAKCQTARIKWRKMKQLKKRMQGQQLLNFG